MKKIKIFPFLIAVCIALTVSAPAAYALEEPNIGAEAAVLVDMNSDRVIYEKNMDEERAPASLTKIMTALLALEAIDDGRAAMDDMVTAPNDCRIGMDETSSTSGIVPGITLSLEELLYSTLLQSANEACNVIAVHIAGSIDAFVALMNARAQELGCRNTNFVNPNGLPAEGHHSTAYDLYLITREALKHPEFLEICNTKSHDAPLPEVNGGKPMENSNALINPNSVYGDAYVYEYASGVKTGYTKAAGYCLISTAEKDGVKLLAVILGCDGYLNAGIEEYHNFMDSINIYNWGFDNFSYQTILSADTPVGKAEIKNAKGSGMAILKPAEDVKVLLPNDISADDVVTSSSLASDDVEAPVRKGQILGEIKISIDGQDYGSVDLVSSSDIELARSKVILMKLKNFFSNGWVIALIVIILVLLTGYLILRVRYNRLRREHMKKRRLMEQRRAEQEREDREREMQENLPDFTSEDSDFSDEDFSYGEEPPYYSVEKDDADAYIPDEYFPDSLDRELSRSDDRPVRTDDDVLNEVLSGIDADEDK